MLVVAKESERGYLIGEKLKRLLEKKNITQYKLSKITGIPQPMISGYIHNKHGISRVNLEKLSKALDVPISYFIEEEPPKGYPPTSDVVEREYVAIPIVTKVGAGGQMYTSDYILMKRSSLPKLKVSGFIVEGDSMEPTIPQGWVVFIDPNDVELLEGKVYLFNIFTETDDNGLVIRRVFKEGDRWIAVPDNRKYKPETIDDGWKVVGRVIKKMPMVEPMNVD